jgi:hypothetical protein
MLRIPWRLLGVVLANLTVVAAFVYALTPRHALAPPIANPPDSARSDTSGENSPLTALAICAPTRTDDGFVNPKVEPGKVKWHATFDAACQASAASGKPVLLFKMMGKLDDQFC